jgi:hypothetical protein
MRGGEGASFCDLTPMRRNIHERGAYVPPVDRKAASKFDLLSEDQIFVESDFSIYLNSIFFSQDSYSMPISLLGYYYCRLMRPSFLTLRIYETSEQRFLWTTPRSTKKGLDYRCEDRKKLASREATMAPLNRYWTPSLRKL